MYAISIIVTCSLLFGGLLTRTKAKLSGKKGPGLLQPVRDILRLLRKGSVFSTDTSTVFRWAPAVYLGCIVTAVCMIPLGGRPGLIAFPGDLVFFSYTLALARAAMILNALDTGSGFEGMGANRESLFATFAEPAFFILAGSLALMTGYDSFAGLFGQLALDSWPNWLVIILAVYILVQLGMIENSRLPVDDPRTHLELTMIHEVMVLDNSGFDLGLIQIANQLKLVLFGSLIANLLLPVDAATWIQIPVFGGVILLYAVLIGVLESFRARYPMNKNPQFILTLTSLSMLVFILVLILNHKI